MHYWHVSLDSRRSYAVFLHHHTGAYTTVSNAERHPAPRTWMVVRSHHTHMPLQFTTPNAIESDGARIVFARGK